MTKPVLTESQRRELHSKDYADVFELQQDPARLSRLIPLINVPDDAVVADFGCGNALMLELLKPLEQKIKAYYGVDFSADLLAYAERRKERLQFKQATFKCCTAESFARNHAGTVDVALAMDFSEHVYDQEWVAILKDIKATLKPNGKLYLHTPNADFFIEIMKDKNFILKQFPEHIAVRNADANSKLLRAAGFDKIEVSYLPHYNFLRLLEPLAKLPMIGKYFQARIFMTAS